MGYPILEREQLNPTVIRLRIAAPLVAGRAQAGQFVILRANAASERIPLTIADHDGETVDVIFQTVGASTMALAEKNAGEEIHDIAGPLGRPTALDGLRKVAVVGGGVGCAIALPVAKALRARGADVTSVIGFRSRESVILEKLFSACSNRLFLTTDDGSAGEKGNVCLPLGRLLEAETFDAVFVVGPLVMMKYAAETTRPYGVKTVASMNPIMIDGTGMCGCCRIRVGGEVKFACVDGPDFDAHLVDFDDAMRRLKTYAAFEAAMREKHCNLYRSGN